MRLGIISILDVLEVIKKLFDLEIITQEELDIYVSDAKVEIRKLLGIDNLIERSNKS